MPRSRPPPDELPDHAGGDLRDGAKVGAAPPEIVDVSQAVAERLPTITEQLAREQEPETEQLFAALKTPGAELDRLMAHAL